MHVAKYNSNKAVNMFAVRSKPREGGKINVFGQNKMFLFCLAVSHQ